MTIVVWAAMIAIAIAIELKIERWCKYVYHTRSDHENVDDRCIHMIGIHDRWAGYTLYRIDRRYLATVDTLRLAIAQNTPRDIEMVRIAIAIEDRIAYPGAASTVDAYNKDCTKRAKK